MPEGSSGCLEEIADRAVPDQWMDLAIWLLALQWRLGRGGTDEEPPLRSNPERSLAGRTVWNTKVTGQVYRGLQESPRVSH